MNSSLHIFYSVWKSFLIYYPSKSGSYGESCSLCTIGAAAAAFTTCRWLRQTDVLTLSMPEDTTQGSLSVIHGLNIVGHSPRPSSRPKCQVDSPLDHIPRLIRCDDGSTGCVWLFLCLNWVNWCSVFALNGGTKSWRVIRMGLLAKLNFFITLMHLNYWKHWKFCTGYSTGKWKNH